MPLVRSKAEKPNYHEGETSTPAPQAEVSLRAAGAGDHRCRMTPVHL